MLRKSQVVKAINYLHTKPNEGYIQLVEKYIQSLELKIDELNDRLAIVTTLLNDYEEIIRNK